MHTAQLDKRGHKFEIAADALCGLEPPLGCLSYGVPEEEAEVGVLAWGSTAGVVREAVEEMAAEGYPVAALVPAVINPLPADRILEFASDLKAVIVPEVNRTGQFAAWVKAHTELHLISLNKYGGLPFTPQEIRAKVMEFLVPEHRETGADRTSLSRRWPMAKKSQLKQKPKLHAQGLQVARQADLVPWLRRLWRAGLAVPGHGPAGAGSGQHGRGFGHRLLQPAALLCQDLRLPDGPRARACRWPPGVKIANPDLTVIAVGGDGDGFSIGGGHLAHAVRRNPDITYVVMDNEVYGLTKGQTSPTSPLGFKTKSTPYGSSDAPINPMAWVLASGVSFAARGFSGNPKHLTDLIVEGIQHPGFAFVQTMSPCPTFNNTFDLWRAQDRGSARGSRSRRPDAGHGPGLPRRRHPGGRVLQGGAAHAGEPHPRDQPPAEGR